MLSYCLNCKKNTENVDPIVSKTKNDKIMLLSKFAVCGTKKTRFIRKQEASGVLSNLGLKGPLSSIPILGGVLF